MGCSTPASHGVAWTSAAILAPIAGLLVTRQRVCCNSSDTSSNDCRRNGKIAFWYSQSGLRNSNSVISERLAPKARSMSSKEGRTGWKRIPSASIFGRYSACVAITGSSPSARSCSATAINGCKSPSEPQTTSPIRRGRATALRRVRPDGPRRASGLRPRRPAGSFPLARVARKGATDTSARRHTGSSQPCARVRGPAPPAGPRPR